MAQVMLGLNKNKFTGELPLSIENMTNLQDLQVENNNLSGSIPESFCFGPFISADCIPRNDTWVECSCCQFCCDETQCCSDEFGFCVPFDAHR
mmetsp:Transcript_25075/g.51089  ORF Transcript_25075/g.51089 Transcript_25075/m.51089 type:complete len:93 (-) Transcript_25075:73-351(-)